MHATLVLLALAAAAPAWAADPLKSEACGRSLAELQAARDGPARSPQVESLRRQATRDCLGGGEPVRPSPAAQSSITVPPPVIEPPLPPRAAVTAPLPAPVRIERPPVITSCDAGGCWDSDGRRLNQAGPVLIGPGGACTTAGATVRCP